MEKQCVEIGYKFGSRKKVHFNGEKIADRTFLDDPPHDSRGTYNELYKVNGGYRVLSKCWSHWQGEEGDNQTFLSPVLTEANLLELHTALANDAGIIESIDLDENPGALDDES